MILDQVLDVDPGNMKAWTRKINSHILFGDIETASAAIAKAEKNAFTEGDKAKLLQFKTKIHSIKNKEKKFSQKVFGGAANSARGAGLYEDKPATTVRQPTPEELNKEENEMLATLGNIEWIMYPFVKTARWLCGKQKRKAA
jgi:chlorite dismutase